MHRSTSVYLGNALSIEKKESPPLYIMSLFWTETKEVIQSTCVTTGCALLQMTRNQFINTIDWFIAPWLFSVALRKMVVFLSSVFSLLSPSASPSYQSKFGTFSSRAVVFIVHDTAWVSPLVFGSVAFCVLNAYV